MPSLRSLASCVPLLILLAGCPGPKPPPELPEADLGEATVGKPYSRKLTATGGTGTLTFQGTGLPPGFQLGSDGTLSGTATAAGDFGLAVTVTDSENKSASRTYPFKVYAAVGLRGDNLPDAVVGTAYSTTLPVTGGKPPLGFGAMDSLPPGLTLDASSGVLSGTPTAAGHFSFRVEVRDGNAATASGSFTLTVAAALAITTSQLAPGNVGTAYSDAIQTTGGRVPIRFAVASGALPPGLTLSTSGVVSGTPTVAGNFTATVSATDAGGALTARDFTVRVLATPPPRITTSALPTATVGTAYAFTLTAADGALPYLWTLLAGPLPPGLSLSTSGAITGTPTAPGTYPLQLSLTDGNGQSAPLTLTLTVVAQLQITTAALPDAYSGNAYSATLAASGGQPPYTWAITNALPPGVSATATGILSGTPAGSGTFGIIATVTDSASRTASLPLTVSVYDVPVLATELGDGSVNAPYSQVIQTTGGKAPFAFTVSSGNLPPGLTLSASGTLSGTPTAAGQFDFTVQAADANGRVASRMYTVFIYVGLAVSTRTLPDGYTGQSYSRNLAAVGGQAPYSWTLASGTLPPGLALAANGTLSGTPTATGVYNFDVQVTDSTVPTADTRVRTLTLAVFALPSITTTSLDDGYVGSAYSNSLSGSAGKPPYAFTVSSGTLPGGLTLSSAGILSGTPTAKTSGPVTLDFTLTDANGKTATKSLALTIHDAVVLAAATLPTGYLTVPYSATLNGSGGKAPLTFSIAAGALPPGLSLSSTGDFSGTPTASGAYSFTVQLADANGKSDSKPMSITVAAALAVTTATLPNPYVGSPYSATLAATGGKPQYTWSLSSGALPSGLGLSAAGVISGTPTAAGTSNFTVKATDGNGTTATSALSLTVLPAVAITTTSLPDGYTSTAYTGSVSVTGGQAPYTTAITAGALPPGLALSSTGGLSGTPTATGTFNFTVTATDANNMAASRPLTITVYALPVITTASPLAEGYAGDPYSVTLATSGGKGPLTFSLTAGALPPGLTLSSTGTIGTALGAVANGQTYGFTVTVADANGRVASKALAITPWIAPSVANTSLTTATEGITYRRAPGTPEGITAVNGKPPLTYAATGLPSGLTIDPSTGVLSGVPAQGSASTYSVTLTVSDVSARSGSKTLPLVVKAAQAIPYGGTAGVEPSGSPVTNALTVFVIDAAGRPVQNMGVRVRKNGVEYTPVKEALTNAAGKVFFTGLGCNGATDTVDITVNGAGFANLTLAKVNAALVTMAPLARPIPLPRYAAAATFDSVLGRVVMAGGFTDPGYGAIRSVCVDDVVAFQGSSWTELVTPGLTSSPAARAYASMAYGGGVDVLFGGSDCFGGYRVLGDTWEFDPNTLNWYPGGAGPQARSGAMMSINGTGGGVLMFGGFDGTGYRNDLWNYDVATHTWFEEVTFGGIPPPRSNGGMAYRASTGEVWLCGGVDSFGERSDCWSYDPAGQAWSPEPAAALPQARSDFGMTYGGQLYIFGGQSNGTDLNDLLTLTGTSWVTVPVSNPRPAARSRATLVYDASSGKLLLMGGYSQTLGVLTDSWTYDTVNGWVLRSPSAAPAGASVSGTLTGKNVANSYAVVTASSASGYLESQEIELVAGAGSYTFTGIPAGDTVEVSAVNEDRALAYPANPSRFWSSWSSGTLPVGAAGSTTTVNIAFPAGPLPLTAATGTFSLPADWRSASISGAPRRQRPGFPAAVNGGFARTSANAFRFDFFAPGAPLLETSYMEAQNDEPNACERSRLYWASGMAGGAQGNVSFVDGPRTITPGLSVCTPAGTGLRYYSGTTAGVTPGAVALGDVNGDGLPDLVTANGGDNSVSVAFGEPAGTFGARGGPDYALLTTSVSQPTAVAVADLDKDGRAEVLVTNVYTAPTRGTLAVFKWTSGTTFAAPGVYNVGVSPTGLAVGNLDGDTYPDAVVVNYSDGSITPLLGNGLGGLTAQTPVSVPTGASSAYAIALGDLVGGTAVDAVVANYGSNSIVVLAGTGTGSFTSPTTLPVGTRPVSVAVANVDGANRGDIVVANEGSNNLSLYFSNGTGFGAQAVLPLGNSPAASPSAVAIGELTGDLLADLAVAVGTTNELRVYKNNGDNTFTLFDTRRTDTYPRAVALGDVVLDGKLDAAVVDNTGAAEVFAQLTPIPFSPEGTYAFSAIGGARMYRVARGPSQLVVDWEYVSRGAPGASSLVFPLPSTLAPSWPAPSGQRVGWDIGMYGYPAGSTFSYDNFRWRDLRQDATVFVGSQGHTFVRQ